MADHKQFLVEVFVMSRIIKVKVGVIAGSPRLKLITFTETLIILDITKTEFNNCFLCIERKKRKIGYDSDGQSTVHDFQE